MTDKYKVSKAVMGELDEVASQKYENYSDLLASVKLDTKELLFWVYGNDHDNSITINREQAVIDFVYNNADNFEVKKPTWVIVSKKPDDFGDWCFLRKDTLFFEMWVADDAQNKDITIEYATRIKDPKLKDALLYAYKDFEAVEVEV